MQIGDHYCVFVLNLKSFVLFGRATKACMYPKDYLSLISDGMAQIHCLLPHLANRTSIVTLQQHLQGVYLHGRGIFIFRTFHNVRNGANLQIHTLLLSLEAILNKEGNDNLF